jgi:hypothetical protein
MRVKEKSIISNGFINQLAEAAGVEPACNLSWSQLGGFEDRCPTGRPHLYVIHFK